jgi:hypothetical protein
MCELAACYLGQGRRHDAQALLRRGLSILSDERPARDPDVRRAAVTLQALDDARDH